MTYEVVPDKDIVRGELKVLRLYPKNGLWFIKAIYEYETRDGRRYGLEFPRIFLPVKSSLPIMRITEETLEGGSVFFRRREEINLGFGFFELDEDPATGGLYLTKELVRPKKERKEMELSEYLKNVKEFIEKDLEEDKEKDE